MDNKLTTITNLFEGKEIRSIWDAEKEDYYFSVNDVIQVLTDSNISKRYWTNLKRKLINEGSELYEKIVRLKVKAQDGKMRETDTLDTKGIFRLFETFYTREKIEISSFLCYNLSRFKGVDPNEWK